MKNLALIATILATLAAPTASFAQDMFPNLTFPDTWTPSVTTPQDTVTMPFVPLLPTEE